MTSLTLTEIAALTGASLAGDGSREVAGPASLEEAVGDEISFLAEARQNDRLASTGALAVVVGDGVECDRDDLILLRCADPQRAFNQVVEAFAPVRSLPHEGTHSSAVIESSARVHPQAHVGAQCYVGEDALVEAGASIRIPPPDGMD